MEIYADYHKGWQKLGKVIPEYVKSGFIIEASGHWCFNTNERDARTCGPDGYGWERNSGNYYVMSVRGEDSYILHDEDAKLGELVCKIGANGEPFRVGNNTSGLLAESVVGQDIWVSMNHGWYTKNSDGSIEVGIRVKPEKREDPVKAGKERIRKFREGYLYTKDWVY